MNVDEEDYYKSNLTKVDRKKSLRAIKSFCLERFSYLWSHLYTAILVM